MNLYVDIHIYIVSTKMHVYIYFPYKYKRAAFVDVFLIFASMIGEFPKVVYTTLTLADIYNMNIHVYKCKHTYIDTQNMLRAFSVCM